MYTNDELETKVREFLSIVARDKNLAKLYSFKINPLDKIDSNFLIDLVSKPSIINYDVEADKLFIIDDNNERIYCPEIEYGVSVSRDWISDSLLPVPFDISQGGNLRKANEAECIYKCCLIAGILKGSMLDDFYDVCNNYDFSQFKSFKSTSMNFSELLAKWQGMQSIIIRIIISGANHKISSEKNLEVGFLIGSLNKDETIGVISIRDRVKSVIRRYMLNELSPNKVSTLSKIARLTLIQAKDDEVLRIINSSNEYSGLYKICSLNSDYIPPSIKNTLINCASDFARKESSKIYSEDEKGFKKFISVCRRRAFKEAVMSLKEKELSNWRQVGNTNYKLPSKK